MWKLFSASLLACLISSEAFSAQGVAYGGPVGGTDIQNAVLPDKAGFYGGLVVGYVKSYSLMGNGGQNSIADFSTSSGLSEFALLYIYPFKLFGGTLGTMVADGGGIGRVKLNDRYESWRGFNDVYSDILMWSTHVGDNPVRGLTVKLAYSMMLAAGTYDSRRIVSTGQNTFYYIPNFALTYLTGPNRLGDGLELDGHVFFDIAGRNPTTNYNNGLVIDIDAAISEIIGRWQIGVAGYYARQVTEDRQNGQIVPGDRFGIAVAGPVIAYSIPEWGASVKLKAQFGIWARNTAKANGLLLFFSKAF
ncbi:phenol degradation protein [Burkholderia lata]|uniref:Phenol degradation protein n=2 Tax=Burkholderia lata (strain ATCC 17760 / DSM 23089 / LMG 22485 / NCIMB 9086 / R18194 / 383) TaxID=482957 RepID=A0A833PL25_BURL3|nr:transporter [Burkholderia lata]ABB06192.1 protein involved in meta-pathway of phenol degradation [Burkholderia lata]KAF1032889.1 MAG: hypothetical protein GAK33_06631 [Burkholderia lata]VWB38908.1 phenol degradation protein [Burkholderia lata]